MTPSEYESGADAERLKLSLEICLVECMTKAGKDSTWLRDKIGITPDEFISDKFQEMSLPDIVQLFLDLDARLFVIATKSGDLSQILHAPDGIEYNAQ